MSCMRNRLFTSLLLVSFLGFTLSACFTQKKQIDKKGDGAADSVIENEILIILKGKIQPTVLEKAFKTFDLKAIKQISKQSNIWLYSFDATKIVSKKMLADVKKSIYVKSAQFNHRVSIRGETEVKQR